MSKQREDPQAFGERFFARQHAEIMARVEKAQTARSQRYPLIGLAAGLALMVSVSALVLFGGAGTQPEQTWAWDDVPTQDLQQIDDPLAPFGLWDTAEDTSTDELFLPPLDLPDYETEPPLGLDLESLG